LRLSNPDDTAGLVQRVLDGRSEVGITELAPRQAAGAAVTVHPIGRHEIVAVLPPGTEAPRALTAAGVAKLPIVAQPVGTSTRGMLDQFLRAAALEPTILVETDQREAIVPLVLAGAGAALLPRPMAEAGAALGAVLVPLVPRLWRDLAIIHRAGALSPAARAFVAAATAIQE